MPEQLPARERILEAASTLMEMQGYAATGLSQILRDSDTPRGSLYYYFPGGKEELAVEAIQRKSRMAETKLREIMEAFSDPAEAVQALVEGIAKHMIQTDCQRGGPLAIVALEVASTNENLRMACHNAYAHRQHVLMEKLTDAGFDSQQAEELATTIVSAIEGGIILSRTANDPAPLKQVGTTLATLIRTLSS